MTAPYRFNLSVSGGKLVLGGVVGTKRIHDEAIRMAIGFGVPIRDDLVIDTGAVHQAAAMSAGDPGAARSNGGGPTSAPSLGALPYTMGSLPYIYPPPLFGRLDDPFFGFEPPLVSYPPWYRAVASREAINLPQGTDPGPGNDPQGVQGPGNGSPLLQGLGNGGQMLQGPGNGPLAPQGIDNGGPMPQGNGPAIDPNQANQSGGIELALGPNPQDGVIEMLLDPQGVAVLRGTVPTLADRVAIGQKIAQLPGISQVVNLLNVGKAGARPVSDVPPPPPQPAFIPGRQIPAAPQSGATKLAEPDRHEPAVAVDGDATNDRITQAFARRPALAKLPIKVLFRDGVATLSGNVPTVYEAMLAYRAVQQTPGVSGVIDRLEFVVPDGEKKNPLREKGRPEDVEPYLAAQIRRQIGDVAHIDQVRLRGDTLEIRGTLVHAEDQPRLNAILRSMAILRDFRLEPMFVVD